MLNSIYETNVQGCLNLFDDARACFDILESCACCHVIKNDDANSLVNKDDFSGLNLLLPTRLKLPMKKSLHTQEMCRFRANRIWLHALHLAI
jgi:hypothetical protein